MYCIVSEHGEEVNTAKGVNIFTEFVNIKIFCLAKNY